MDKKIIKDLLICDFTKEENQKLIKEALCEIKPLAKYSLSSDLIPFEVLERIIIVNTKKYAITPQYIMFRMFKDGSIQWQISLKRDDTKQWLGSYSGKTIYEVFAKGLLRMYNCIIDEGIPIRDTKEQKREEQELKETLGKMFQEEGEINEDDEDWD